MNVSLLRLTGGIAVCAAALACNPHPLTPLADSLSAGVVDVSDPLGSDQVDILWVIDSSGSMREEQAELGLKFNALIEALVGIGADFRIAVISTDMSSPNARGRFQTAPGRFVEKGCAGPTDALAAECADVDLDRPFLSIDSYTSGTTIDTARLQRDFRCIASVGDCGSQFEAGLWAVETAVSEDLVGSDGVNSGFFREDAFLAVIFLTDEDDCSFGGTITPATDKQCYVAETRPSMIPVQRVYDALVALKGGDESRILLAGIVGPDDNLPPPPDSPTYAPIISCNSALGGSGGSQSARDGERYRALIDLAGDRGIEESICQGDYTVALRGIGDIIRANLDLNCINAAPRTCENAGDCAPGVDCLNPGDPIVGSSFCADFEMALEVASPEAPGTFTPYVGPGPVGNVPAPDAQYSVDYDAVQCPRVVAFRFEDGQRPPSGSRFRLSYPRSVEVITVDDLEGEPLAQ
jgi:hypothetical protein